MTGNSYHKGITHKGLIDPFRKLSSSAEWYPQGVNVKLFMRDLWGK